MRESVGTLSAKLGLGQSVLVRFLPRKTSLSSQHGVVRVSKRSGYVGVEATITKHECAICPAFTLMSYLTPRRPRNEQTCSFRIVITGTQTWALS